MIDDLKNLPVNMGLFPRAALNVLDRIKNRSEQTIFTMNISEANFREPRDLLTKDMIHMNPKIHEFEGYSE